MFIDEVSMELFAGNGGNGCMAFRREKFVPMGGPYGGNGGRGSDIIFKVDEGLNTLLDLKYHRIIKGKRGENGLGKGMHGKKASDIIIKVPLGTVITNLETKEIIADLVDKTDEVIVAHGGRGGRGNIALATRSNPAPSFAENGEPGEHIKIKVELKLLADVGLVGLPSVGKSTIISSVTSKKPAIAEYHFTTLVPNLGVVKPKVGTSFVLADLPGLIKGASLGLGLGDRFLKHIERTRVIAHVIDMGGFEGRNPVDDYHLINQELALFNPDLLKKPQIILANKMDLENAKENLEKFKKEIKDVEIIPISASTHQGLDEAMNKLSNMVSNTPKTFVYEKNDNHIVYKYEEEKPFTIKKENSTYIVTGKQIEKILKMTKFQTDESVKNFTYKLKKLGVDETLRQMGIKNGDTVKILDLEFDWEE